MRRFCVLLLFGSFGNFGNEKWEHVFSLAEVPLSHYTMADPWYEKLSAALPRRPIPLYERVRFNKQQYGVC